MVADFAVNGNVSEKASPPFDEETADIILRSRDGVDFYVYKVILSLSSPFFKSMFSLKQPTNSAFASAPGGQPIIDVQETSQTLDKLLRHCYPVPDPDIYSMREVGDVLEAAIKYEMEKPTIRMKKLLHEGTESQPLQTFAVACRLNMEPEAMAAARVWKDIRPYFPELPLGHNSIFDFDRSILGQCYVDEMSHITAGAFYRLLRFAQGHNVPAFCESKSIPTSTPIHILRTIQPTPLPVFDGQQPDLIIRSSDNVDFRVHKAIIVFASSMLKFGTDLPPSPEPLPIVAVDAHSAILDLVIQLCYPLEDPVITDAELAIRLLNFASQIKARRAKDLVRRQLVSSSNLDPLRLFFIAAQHGWELEARAAVLRLLHSDIDACYTPEMEDVPARMYRALLKHHYECLRVLTSVTYRETGTSPAVIQGIAPINPPQHHEYASVAPAIYAPMVAHSLSVVGAMDPSIIAYSIGVIREDSIKTLAKIQDKLSGVSLDL